jgi:hypothetical protein
MSCMPSIANPVFTAGLNANQGFSSSIARLIFSGLGPASGGVVDFGFGAGNPGPPGVALGARGRQVRWRNPPTNIEDALFSDGEDGSDDDQTGYSDFVTSMRRMHQHRAGGSAVFGAYPSMMSAPRVGQRTGRAAAFHAAMAAAPQRYSRSYATNAHDVDAGETAANALEIEDDSDDEVEVVDVRQRDV